MAQHDYDIANGSGASVRSDINNTLDAIVSLNSGVTEPAVKFAYMPWFDTSTGILKIRNAANSAWISVMLFTASEQYPYSRNVPQDIEEVAFASNATTPDVSGGIRFATNNSVPVTITNFVGSPQAGWRFTMRAADANTTVSGSLTGSGRAIPMLSGEYMVFQYDGSSWSQVGGNVGMGTRYVHVDPAVNIVSWIANGQTAFTDVGTSLYGVRKGAQRVHIAIHADTVTLAATVQCRIKGSADTGNDTSVLYIATPADIRTFVRVDDDAIFQARVTSALAGGTNFDAATLGYLI